MKFTLTSEKEDGTTLTENYDKENVKTLEGAEAWAKETLVFFNDSRKPFEQKRSFLKVEKIENPPKDSIG